MSGIKRICAFFLAALVIFAAGETLYRIYWACKCTWSTYGDKDGYFSLYIVGESTALGAPYGEIGLSSLILNSFDYRILGREVRVFRLARHGESVYPQAIALERSLRCRDRNNPGAVLVYSGHNGATSETGIPAFERFRETVLSGSMLLSDLGFYAEKMFPSLRVRTLDTYEHYMRHIIEISLESGLTPIVSTLVSNMADMDPALRSEDGHSGTEMQFILAKGLNLESRQSQKEAILYYSRQARAHPRMRTYLKYRIGKCYQALGQYATAEQYYSEIINSAEKDNFGRATSSQNDLIRRLTEEYSVPLADAVKIFKKNSPHGLLGNSLFSDGHHPNMSGYLLLAKAYAQNISKVFHEPIRHVFPGPAAVFQSFSYGKDQQARALVSSGKWLFNSAARHGYPGERLRMANTRLQNAVALDPNSFSAWLGLGLTEAALNGGLFSSEENMDWISRYGLFSYGTPNVTADQIQEIINKFSSCGVPRVITDRISLEAGKEFATYKSPLVPHSHNIKERNRSALSSLSGGKSVSEIISSGNNATKGISGSEKGAAAPNMPAGPNIKAHKYTVLSAYKIRSKKISDSAIEKTRSGDFSAASNLLHKALTVDRYNYEALITLCGVLISENKIEEALKNCKEASSAVRSSGQNQLPGLIMLATEAEFTTYKLLVSLGREQEAEETLQNCVRSAPRDWTGLTAAVAELKKLTAK